LCGSLDRVIPGTVVLLHSPLLTAAAWGDWPAELERTGVAVLTLDVQGDLAPPYAAAYIASSATQIAAATAARDALVLVGHSGAGPLMPQVATACRAGRRPVRGYVFLDAGLPRPGASRLDLMATEDAESATALRDHLTAGGRFPDWTADDIADSLPDPAARALVVASMRSRDLTFFTEAIPGPDDWPDAPCGYLQTSSAYDQPAGVAARRGWPVEHLDAGHFAPLAAPTDLAASLRTVLERL
jgi:hypothetical protein